MSKAFPTKPSQEPHTCEQEGNLIAAQCCATKHNCSDTAKYLHLTAFPQLLLGPSCPPSVLHMWHFSSGDGHLCPCQPQIPAWSDHFFSSANALFDLHPQSTGRMRENIAEAEQKCTSRALGGHLSAFCWVFLSYFFSILLVAGSFPSKETIWQSQQEQLEMLWWFYPTSCHLGGQCLTSTSFHGTSSHLHTKNFV